MVYILDACAMIAYLRGENGADVVEDMLIENNKTCIAHTVNLCEVFYHFIKAENEEIAENAISDLEDIGIIFREDMDTKFWKEAGKYKANNKVSLADSIAMALTQREKAILVTSDHHEFDAIVKEEICDVRFIR